MANYNVTSAQWDALLQENYILKNVVDAINKATVFKTKLQRKRMSHGRRDIYPVMLGVHQGVGARAENTALPQYGGGVYADVIVTSKYNYAQSYITGQAKVFSSQKAFVQFAMRLMRDTKEGMTLDIGRQMWGDGSGTLALVSPALAAAGTVPSIINAYGVAWGSTATNTTFLFKINMVVQFGVDDNAGAGYTVTAISGTTITVTPAVAAGVAINTRVYRLGAKDNEIEGWLKGVASSAFMTGVLGQATGVYHGIDRSVNPDWEGNVTDFGGAALSLSNFRTLKDKGFRRGSTPDLCIASPEETAAYEALLTPNQRFMPAVKLSGGATAIEHDGLKFTKDKDAPVKAINLVSTDGISIAQREDPNWIKQGDSILRVKSGFDAEEATMRWYSNLDFENPKDQILGYNLA